MSQPTQPPDTTNSSNAAHNTAITAETVPQDPNIVTTPVLNSKPAPKQFHTTSPANSTNKPNAVRHDTPQNAPPTAAPTRHTLPSSGDGDHPSVATWGPSIFNMVLRAERDPIFDLSAQRT